MNNRLLGSLAMLGAPFLLIGFYVESQVKSLENSWFTGVWGLVYMLGWMAAIVGLQRLEATGTDRFDRIMLRAVIGTLTVANLSNLYQIVLPGEKSTFFFVLDACWPISNVLMIPVGVAAITANRLPGWQRYVPLFVGLWFPFCMLTMNWLGRVPAAMLLGGFYSAIAWLLLGYVIFAGKTVGEKPLAVVMS